MSKYLVDWFKEPEIKFVQKLCPICRQPTGPSSNCSELGPARGDEDNEDEDKLSIRTAEIEGNVEPILSEQCFFRRYKIHYVHTNQPISQPLAVLIGSVEGVEKFNVTSPYRAELVIGDLFDDNEVLTLIERTYQEFCDDKRQKQEAIFQEQEEMAQKLLESLDAVKEQVDKDSGQGTHSDLGLDG